MGTLKRTGNNLLTRVLVIAFAVSFLIFFFDNVQTTYNSYVDLEKEIENNKLEKQIIDRRVEILKAEGILFVTNTNIGKDLSIQDLQNQNDAVLLCGGATKARTIPIKGSDLKGVYPAMTFLKKNNQHVDQQL